jgi:vacuolar-type H+-ATPase subunit F/Vma7
MSDSNRAAVIGPKDIISAFSAVGFDIYPSDDAVTNGLVQKLADEYPLILITEREYSSARDTIQKYAAVPYPIILQIPNVSEGA